MNDYVGQEQNNELKLKGTNSDTQGSVQNGDWFLLRNNNHLGPYTQKQLFEFYYQGIITEYSLLWKDEMLDWQPLKKINELYQILKPEIKNVDSLPDLPDLRMIELEAQKELDEQIPPPRIKKTIFIDGENRKKFEAAKNKINMDKASDKMSGSQTDQKKDLGMYESSLDEKNQFRSTRPMECGGTIVSLPPLPIDDGDFEQLLQPAQAEIQLENPNQFYENEKSSIPVSPLIIESKENNRWIYNLLSLGIFSLFFTIPIFYIIISNRPVAHSMDNMSKEAEQLINFATTEVHNNNDIMLNVVMNKDKSLYGGVNRSGHFVVKGSIEPVSDKIAGKWDKNIILTGESHNGLIKFSPEGGVAFSNIPEGLYKVNLNLMDNSNLGKFYYYLKKYSFFDRFDFIKNYRPNFSVSNEAWLGRNSVFLTKRLVDEFQRGLWENVHRPFDYLFQQYETLNSLIDRFNEIYFNSTTAKTFAKSKIMFARKFGREVAPVLQMIGTEELTEEHLAGLKLPEELLNIYKNGFETAKRISQSVSAVAGDIDLFLSVNKEWNRYIRIEQRNKISKDLSKLKDEIKSVSEQLDQKVKTYQQNND